MKKLNLPPLAIAGIGVFLCLLAVGLLYGLVIKPNQDALAAQKAIYDANYPDSTPGAQSAAKGQLAAAKAQVAQTQAQWGTVEARKMPRYDVGGPRLVAWQELSRELTDNLAPSIEHYVPTTGVVPLFATVGLQGPPANPNDIPVGPLVIPISGASGGSSFGGGASAGPGPGRGGFGPGPGAAGGGGVGGSLSVGGDFRRLLYHVQRWNNFDRLVLLDNLGMHGTSPYMSATYNAEVIIFPQGIDKPAPPMATGGAGAGGVRAGVGGPGIPGGPGAPPTGAGGPPPGPGGPPTGPGGAGQSGAIPGDPAPAAAP